MYIFYDFDFTNHHYCYLIKYVQLHFCFIYVILVMIYKTVDDIELVVNVRAHPKSDYRAEL